MKSRAISAVVALLAFTSTANAWVIDFDALSIRDSNSNPGVFPTITEYADGTGVETNVPEGGQKVSYATDYFNGRPLADIQTIEFTYNRNVAGDKSDPYTNLVITDGSGAYGVIYSPNIDTLSQSTDDKGTTDTSDDVFTRRLRVHIGDSASTDAFKFYEPAGGSPWTHGAGITWDDIDDWYLLGAGDTRPLSSGEAGEARAPVNHAVGIMWGDSAANYLGPRDIFDVKVVAKVNGVNQEFTAGAIPEPFSASLVMLGGIAMLARRRR